MDFRMPTEYSLMLRLLLFLLRTWLGFEGGFAFGQLPPISLMTMTFARTFLFEYITIMLQPNQRSMRSPRGDDETIKHFYTYIPARSRPILVLYTSPIHHPHYLFFLGSAFPLPPLPSSVLLDEPARYAAMSKLLIGFEFWPDAAPMKAFIGFSFWRSSHSARISGSTAGGWLADASPWCGVEGIRGAYCSQPA